MILRLTRDMVVQLLGKPDLYDRVPEFLPMRDQALKCYDEYLKILNGKPCPGCTAKSVMRPAIVSFIELLEAADAKTKKELKAFIGDCRNEQLLRVEISHKSQGVVKEFQF